MDEIESLENILQTTSGAERASVLNRLSKCCLASFPGKCLEYCKQALELSEILDLPEERLAALLNFGAYYRMVSDYEKALGCYQESLQTSEKAGNNVLIVNSLQNIGTTYVRKGNYDLALDYLKKALNKGEEIGDDQGISDSLSSLGLIYQYKGDYDKSLECQMKSLSLREKIDDKKGIAYSLTNIGVIYWRFKNYHKALDYFFNALSIEEDIDDIRGISYSLNNIGLMYEYLKEYDKALEYYNKALRSNEKKGDKSSMAININNIGEIYSILHNYDEALKYFIKSLEIKKDIGDKNGAALTSNNIGQLYLKIKNYDSALYYIEQCFASAQEINSKELIKESYLAFSELHSAQGHYPKALEYYKLYTETKDIIFTEDSSKKIAEMQTKYETEKKEKEAEIYRLRNVELAEANQAITQAKEIIEEKNRHITSSIEYARRIQQAVLPPAGKMQAALPEHFVLFKPRDIVSGDFYWFSQTGGKILIAVVDCTGHGVPGAFMSMIGSMLLNTIVNENGETGPAKILEQLHVAVRSALKQHDAEADTTDGMDVCLCAIEQGSKRLVYAGAKRPLYLVRNKELTEIAGDGKSIGGRQKEEKRAFSEKQFAVQSGDMIYLTSDGYSDQCDPEGRKIGSRRLKELLIQVSGESHAGQRAALLAELEAHQASEEQRDDIAIVGIRI